MVAKAGVESDYVFRLPDLGEGLEEAELIEWLVQVGQSVRENDVLARMETAKALVDVPSPRGGTIAVLHAQPGQTVKVGAPLVTFGHEGNGTEPARVEAPRMEPSRVEPARVEMPSRSEPRPPGAEPSREPRTGAPPPPRSTEPGRPSNGPARADAGSVVGDLSGAPAEEHVLAAPAVRKLARELGIDLSQIAGTGLGGRIMIQDVRAAATGSPAPHAAAQADTGVDEHEHEVAEQVMAPSLHPAPAPPRAASVPSPASPSSPSPVHESDRAGGERRIPLRGTRRTIAEHLQHSVAHAVHFTVMDDADITALESLRRKLGAAGEKITVLPFVAAAVCRLLRGRAGEAFVQLNATVDDAKQEIVQHGAVHLGIATDTPGGLVVPVLADAHQMGVFEIGRQITALAAAARERSLKPAQLRGSTFTLSNFGPAGGRFATPIINYPEVAILAIGRVRDGVVVRQGMLGVGKRLPLSLTADHRIIDGATLASALAKLIELLAKPEDLMEPAG